MIAFIFVDCSRAPNNNNNTISDWLNYNSFYVVQELVRDIPFDGEPLQWSQLQYKSCWSSCHEIEGRGVHQKSLVEHHCLIKFALVVFCIVDTWFSPNTTQSNVEGNCLRSNISETVSKIEEEPSGTFGVSTLWLHDRTAPINGL